MVQREQASLSSLSGRVLLLVLTGTDRSAAHSSVSVRAEIFEMFVVFFFFSFYCCNETISPSGNSTHSVKSRGWLGWGLGLLGGVGW